MKISEVHGQLNYVKFGDDELVVMPLYHPAVALYKGSMRQTLIDDFLNIPNLLAKLN